MDVAATIERVYHHVEDDQVDKAAMACLRIARHVKDYLHAAIFLRELCPDEKELIKVFHEDTSHLKEEAQSFLWKTSAEYWRATHTSSTPITTEDPGGRPSVVTMGIGEIGSDIQRCERAIEDMTVPAGMCEFDTAAFTDRNAEMKACYRLRITAFEGVRQRVRTRCLNYAISIEKQLAAQRKPQSFLEQAQREVNNYFAAHCEDAYHKLLRATQLVDSTDPEDCSLLLTEIRRAVKAVADFLYPPQAGEIACADGKSRKLGDAEFLNRLEEYVCANLGGSTPDKLLRSELDLFIAFVRRLSDSASKGVHAQVSVREARQGLLGLYLFLYNLVSHIQERQGP